MSFEAIERNLNRALELAKDCHAAVQAAGPEIRRQLDQAFFEKLYVHQSGEVTHDFAEPFKILLDPQLDVRLAASSSAPGITFCVEDGSASEQ